MSTKNESDIEADELREEYDLSALEGGVRGKYFDQAKKGTNIVLLDPDIARAFPTSESVNRALRMLLKVAETTAKADTEP